MMCVPETEVTRLFVQIREGLICVEVLDIGAVIVIGRLGLESGICSEWTTEDWDFGKCTSSSRGV